MAEVLYAAYGDMSLVLPELLGRKLEAGKFAVLHGVELGVQAFSEVPDDVHSDAPAPVSPRTILSESWDDSFRTYVVKKTDDEDKLTPVLVHKISYEEREIILDEWNLGIFGWFHDLSVKAKPIDGSPQLDVVTDAISEDQTMTAYNHYRRATQPALNGKRSLEIARVVRQNYLNRLAS